MDESRDSRMDEWMDGQKGCISQPPWSEPVGGVSGRSQGDYNMLVN